MQKKPPAPRPAEQIDMAAAVERVIRSRLALLDKSITDWGAAQGIANRATASARLASCGRIPQLESAAAALGVTVSDLIREAEQLIQRENNVTNDRTN
jgi:hypothetical protein